MTLEGESINDLPLNELVKIIFKNKDNEERIKALKVIGERKDIRALSFLSQLASNKDEELRVRLEAIESLRKLEDLRGVDTLISLFNNSETPPQIRALAISSIFSMDLRRAVDIGLSFLVSTPQMEHPLIYISILDSLAYYFPLLSPKATRKIRLELEELFDKEDIRNDFETSLTLASTLTIYGSLLGIKYILYQKKRLRENFKPEYKPFLDAIELVLADLKNHYSLSSKAPDLKLYKVVQEVHQKSNDID